MEIPDFSKYPALDEYFNKKKEHFILDENKNVIPASLLEWGEFFENTREERIVNRTEINGLRVSTVFLGLDHSFDGSLHIFETMVFKKKSEVGYCERYSTWQEAEEGHKRAIEWVKNGCKDEDTEISTKI